MCGALRVCPQNNVNNAGSSPHVRGTLVSTVNRTDSVGLIPACAGHSTILIPCSAGKWAHPRMCGALRTVYSDDVPQLGSSPHVRGTQDAEVVSDDDGGLIPACAGHSRSASQSRTSCRAHPRMCGALAKIYGITSDGLGSSPHVRGTRIQTKPVYSPQGLIPACAGHSAARAWWGAARRAHPRMCGALRWVCSDSLSLRGSSPHVRGTQVSSLKVKSPLGLIPACAGHSTHRGQRINRFRAHPRMCGALDPWWVAGHGEWGSSPHVRGTR